MNIKILTDKLTQLKKPTKRQFQLGFFVVVALLALVRLVFPGVYQGPQRAADATPAADNSSLATDPSPLATHPSPFISHDSPHPIRGVHSYQTSFPTARASR